MRLHKIKSVKRWLCEDVMHSIYRIVSINHSMTIATQKSDLIAYLSQESYNHNLSTLNAGNRHSISGQINHTFSNVSIAFPTLE